MPLGYFVAFVLQADLLAAVAPALSQKIRREGVCGLPSA
jgi:hypothetical protein